jgi:hypothetical protein
MFVLLSLSKWHLQATWVHNRWGISANTVTCSGIQCIECRKKVHICAILGKQIDKLIRQAFVMINRSPFNEIVIRTGCSPYASRFANIGSAGAEKRRLSV